MNSSKFMILFVVIGLTSGCSIHPKFYPNDVYKNATKEKLDKDMEECEELASNREITGTQTSWEVFKNVAAITSVLSPRGSYADVYAWENTGPSLEEDRKSFITTCLQHKGYEVTGWSL